MAVKVDNVYIRENASSSYERVNTVYANGNQVFGTKPFSSDGIYITYKGIEGTNFLYEIDIQGGAIWAEGQEMTFVGYLGQTTASSPYEYMGSLFKRGEVTIPTTHDIGILSIPRPAEINALYIGVKILSGRSGSYKDLENIYRNFTHPDGNVISEGRPYISIQLQDNSKAYLTNLPFGGGQIMDKNDDVWLVYRGQPTWSGNQLVYGATNWNIRTSNIWKR